MLSCILKIQDTIFKIVSCTTLKTSGNLKATVINYMSQGTASRYLRYCGIFNENLLQFHC